MRICSRNLLKVSTLPMANCRSKVTTLKLLKKLSQIPRNLARGTIFYLRGAAWDRRRCDDLRRMPRAVGTKHFNKLFKMFKEEMSCLQVNTSYSHQLKTSTEWCQAVKLIALLRAVTSLTPACRLSLLGMHRRSERNMKSRKSPPTRRANSQTTLILTTLLWVGSLVPSNQVSKRVIKLVPSSNQASKNKVSKWLLNLKRWCNRNLGTSCHRRQRQTNATPKT